MNRRTFPFYAAWGYLALLAAGAFLAGWLAPHAPRDEDRSHSFHPPTCIHWIARDGGFAFRPFVCGTRIRYDENLRRVYEEDFSKKYPLKWLGKKFVCVDAPGRLYLLGADARGRDLFSRILYGARVSLSVGVVGALFASLVGLAVGSLAGYFGGALDEVLMRVAEFFMMIPVFYLLLALRSVLPMNLGTLQVYLLVVVLLSLVGWGAVARIVRGLVATLRERDFIQAARVLGRPFFEIIVRHVVPHTFSYLAVVLSTSIPGYILAESALSLLGLGIQEPAVSWGNLLSEALAVAHLELHPWVIWPGIFITLTAFSCNILGDAYAHR